MFLVKFRRPGSNLDTHSFTRTDSEKPWPRKNYRKRTERNLPRTRYTHLSVPACASLCLSVRTCPCPYTSRQRAVWGGGVEEGGTDTDVLCCARLCDLGPRKILALVPWHCGLGIAVRCCALWTFIQDVVPTQSRTFVTFITLSNS